MKKNKNSLLLDIGWCEWVSFPALKIPAIEAQVVMDSRQSILNICAYMFANRGDCPTMSAGLVNSGNIDLLNTYRINQL